MDINTDVVKTLLEESLNTYVEIQKPGILKSSEEFIEWSERDGWAHLYLYDKEGKLKNQITQGPWHIEEVISIDEEKELSIFLPMAKKM